MEPANRCRICIASLPGSVRLPGLVSWRAGRFLDRNEPSLPPLDILHRIIPTTDTGIPGIEMQQGVIRAAAHAATRCALAITALLPGINLRNFTFEEES